jgi:hypothetical protein
MLDYYPSEKALLTIKAENGQDKRRRKGELFCLLYLSLIHIFI